MMMLYSYILLESLHSLYLFHLGDMDYIWDTKNGLALDVIDTHDWRTATACCLSILKLYVKQSGYKGLQGTGHGFIELRCEDSVRVWLL